jgi:hypothetical protein
MKYFCGYLAILWLFCGYFVAILWLFCGYFWTFFVIFKSISPNFLCTGKQISFGLHP